jgi:hypothetical protein
MPHLRRQKPDTDWWIVVINYVKSKMSEYRTKHEKEAPQDRAARLTAAATVSMAIFTLVLTAVSVGTWLILKNQLDEMHSGGLLDQRAWLAVESISGEEKVGTFFVAIVRNKNTGKTPAINMHFGGNLEPTNTAPNVALDCTAAMKNPARVLIAPGGVHFIPVKADAWGKLDEDWHQKLGDRLVYIHGCLLYDDIFNRPHWLTFCGYWKNDIQAFENCEAGNNTGDGDGPNPT